jgi:hypothetical protein
VSHAEIKRILHGMLVEYTRAYPFHAGQIDALHLAALTPRARRFRVAPLPRALGFE